VDPDSRRLPPSRPGRFGEQGRRVSGGLTVIVSDGRGRPVRDGGLARWLGAVAPPRVRGEVAVALVTDAHVRKLNRRYRRKDTPTDVLSFAADRGSPPFRDSADGFLGDIVIATGVARRQAREARQSYANELRVLALHGLLHLLGYDHDASGEGGRMSRAEARLRRKGGLESGLMERSRRK
jgi:probable rRNA maturation factor